MISEKMKGYVANSSVIRAMFEESRIFLTMRIRFWSTAI